MMLAVCFLVYLWAPPLARADVTAVLNAKSANELYREVKQSENERTLYRRCQAELRGNYLPEQCYVWLEKAPLSSEKKSVFRRTFDEVCGSRLADSQNTELQVGDKTVEHLANLGGNCQKSLEKWLAVKMYKLNKENSGELFEKLESGRVFETLFRNANHKSVSQNRVHSSRADRRRLN